MLRWSPMTHESPAVLVAWWGAGLSTLLAGIKIWEIWRDRFQLDVSHNLTSSESIGNTIFIRNLSGRPVILGYWELLYCSGHWPNRKFQAFEQPEHDAGDNRIEPYSTSELHFADEHHFDWGHRSLNGRRIYIRLHIAGRRPVLRLVYPTK
jgi:hypothetical protein